MARVVSHFAKHILDMFGIHPNHLLNRLFNKEKINELIDVVIEFITCIMYSILFVFYLAWRCILTLLACSIVFAGFIVVCMVFDSIMSSLVDLFQ